MTARKDCSHFIPLLTPELVNLLCADHLADLEREQLRHLADLTAQVHHRHYHRRLAELKNAYSPFDPDSDAVPLERVTSEQRQGRLNDLLSDLAWLLDRAHFRHLSREEIEPMLLDFSDWGIRMDVDFSAFEHCAIFVRGESFDRRRLRSWRTLFREEEIDVPIFRRLVLVLKLRRHPRLGPDVRTDHVYLKVFKDLPRADVDMLLPGARVSLKLLDRGRVGFGFLSGLATIGFRKLDDLVMLMHKFTLSGDALWGLTAGVLGYGYKSYYDYQTTRQAYHLNLTQNLYFQNLDSNAGVLTRLFDEAEEQETRTTLLSYFCLWRYAGPDGFTSEELEAAMELYLDRYTGITLLCEQGEPAAKLARLGLAVLAGNRCQALSPPRALEAMQAAWDRLAPHSESKQTV